MSRNRQRTKDLGTGTVGRTIKQYGTTINDSWLVDLGTEYEYSRDNVNPDFRDRIRRGEDVSSNFYYEKTYPEYPVGEKSWSNSDGSRIFSWKGETVNIAATAHSFTEMYDNINCNYPKSSCIAALDPTPRQMMEDVFEVRETLRLLRSPLSGLLALSKTFKKRRQYLQRYGRHKGSKRWRGLSRSKALSQAWLEYRFAWMPLYNSASTILDYLKSDSVKYPERRTVRRTERYSDNVESFRTNHYGETSKRVNITHAERSAGICYYVTNPVTGWRHELGLRNKDIPETLWNIVPLSFMVDRLINISDMIRGATNLADPDVHIHHAWITERVELSGSGKAISKVSLPSHDFSGSYKGGGVTYNKFIYHRRAWIPTGLDVFPSFDWTGLISSVTKTIDLLALIRQNLK